MPVKLAVIYYSATGKTHALAEAIAEGARDAGAEVRLRRVAELAPEEAIRQNDAWHEHYQQQRSAPEATLDDLEWADAFALGSPTRFGLPSSQLKQFIDQTGPLWGQGKLVDKVASAFTSTSTDHGGQESTALAISNVFYHWGCIIVPPAYADPVQFETGTPYGASFASHQGNTQASDAVLRAARFQGRRMVEVARRLLGNAQA